MRLGCVPGGRVDRCSNCTGTNAVDADSMRSQFLRHALHQQHHSAFRCSIVGVTAPRSDLMHGAHADDLARSDGYFGSDSATLELPYCFSRTEKLSGQVDTDDGVPLL